MSALAAALQKVSFQKKDFDLDIEELEEAATMVLEEEDGASKSASVHHSSNRFSDSSASGEDDEAEAEGQVGAESRCKEGGESSKDSPLKPPHTSAVCAAIPLERAATQLSEENKVHILPQAPLIQELGELKISEEFRGGPEAEREPSQRSGASSGGNGGETLFESSPRTNPLLIIPKGDGPHTPDLIL